MSSPLGIRNDFNLHPGADAIGKDLSPTGLMVFGCSECQYRTFRNFRLFRLYVALLWFIAIPRAGVVPALFELVA
jgi:hypothetical protein